MKLYPISKIFNSMSRIIISRILALMSWWFHISPLLLVCQYTVVVVEWSAVEDCRRWFPMLSARR